MKKIIGYAFLLFVFACNQQKSAFEKTVPKHEARCLKRIELAKKDIREGRLTFCDTLNDDYKSRNKATKEEKNELFKKYNIRYTFTYEYSRYIPDDIVMKIDLNDKVNCYCKYMREQIDKKYGINFIDSIMDAAEDLYFTKFIDFRFSEKDCDVPPIYPGDEEYSETFSNSFSEDFKQLLLKSVGRFNSKHSDNKGYVQICINVDRDGTAQLSDYELYLNSNSKYKYKGYREINPPTNPRYEDYLKENLIKIVKTTGWTPAKVRGQHVYSYRTIGFYFDFSDPTSKHGGIEKASEPTFSTYKLIIP